MVDIEKTLTELALAMQGHRDALARRGDAPERRAAPLRDVRTALIARLLVRIEADAGLRVDATIEAKLHAVLASVGLGELDGWVSELEALDGDHPHWLALIESLTTSETYLFRDWEQLELLRTAGLAPLVAEAQGEARPGLRLWSAGCASGEEAYSLAVFALEALVDAGHARETPAAITLAAPWTLDVLGTDVSRRLIAQAQNGLYSTGSLSPFRAVPEPLLRFFPPVESEPGRPNRRVRQDVGRHVRFAQANLMTPHAPATDFDVVACRNVLVYFTPAAREVVQAAVEAAVRPGGFLLLGPTDARPDAQRFDSIWGARTVVYRRRA
jgi:chemotaxis protein methyltransferase CheR